MVLSEIFFRIYDGKKEPNLTENIQNVLDLQTDNIILKNDSNTLTQILCEFGYQGNKEISVSAFFCSKSNHDSSCSGAEYSNHKVSKGKNTLDFTLSKNEDCLQKISKDDLAVCFYFKEGTKEVFKKTIGFSELRKQ
jgi:hypothetical protein